jgi:hypothetical protein
VDVLNYKSPDDIARPKLHIRLIFYIAAAEFVAYVFAVYCIGTYMDDPDKDWLLASVGWFVFPAWCVVLPWGWTSALLIGLANALLWGVSIVGVWFIGSSIRYRRFRLRKAISDELKPASNN